MRSMMLIKHPGDYDIRDVPPSLFGPMGEFVEESMKKGTIIDGAGLQPLAKATRLRLVGGKIKVTDSQCEVRPLEEAGEPPKA